jgi:hypothetical protein
MPDISDLQPSAIGHFLAGSLVGAFQTLGRAHELSLTIAARLIDKARYEYTRAREAAIAEEKEGTMTYEEILQRGQGQFMYIATITNHLENCINALARIYATNRDYQSSISSTIVGMRNMMEHMDEKLSESTRGPISPDIAEDASEIKILFQNKKNPHAGFLILKTADLAEEIRRIHSKFLRN